MVIFFARGVMVGWNLLDTPGEATTAGREHSEVDVTNVAFVHQSNGYSWVYERGKATKV